MKSKLFNYSKVENIILFLALIVFTIPKSIDLIPVMHTSFNVLKIVFSLLLLVIFGLKKFKSNKILKIFLIYTIYIIILTFINGQNVMLPIKTYILNLFTLLLAFLIIKSNNNKKILNHLSIYFLILIIIATFQSVTNLTFDKLFGSTGAQTILGQDNRMVLYIFLEMLLLSYDIEKNKKLIISVLILGFILTLTRWSVMSFISIVIISVVILYYKITKKELDLYVFLALFVVFSLFLVFFDMNSSISKALLGIFNKSTSFKYRQYIWMAAIKLLKSNPINILFGFGFFDTQNYLRSVYPWASYAMTPNHLHNLPLNSLFFSGLIGFLVYEFFLIEIIKGIKINKNFERKMIYSAIFVGLLFLLLMDTFEYYQIYYLILALLYNMSINDNRINKHKKKKK